MGASAVLAGIQIGTQLLNARDQRKGLKFQRDQVTRDAHIAKEMAEQREADFRRKASRSEAATRTAMSGSGIDYTEGSFAAVQEDQAVENELGALNIRYQGALDQTKFKDKWASLDFEKDLNQRNAWLDAGTGIAKGALGG